MPKVPPPIREVVHWIAGLGGFLRRKGDGEPGCFSFSKLKFFVQELYKVGVPLRNIFLKFKQKRFCKDKTQGVGKYRKVVQRKSYDLGFQKSHILRADQFLKLSIVKMEFD